MSLVVVVLLLLSVAVCCFPSYMAKIFSKDEDFVDGVVEASTPLACLMITMNLTVALEVTDNSTVCIVSTGSCKAIVSTI